MSDRTPVNTQLHAWGRLTYRDPEPLLRDLRTLEIASASWDLNPKVHRLRTADLKTVREGRNAAIFSHGMASVAGSKVYFADSEDSDYDFVTHWLVGEERHYCPVQLKELVPNDLNPHATLTGLFEGLAKYQQTETVLAVLLNRPVQMALTELPPPARRFSQVWLFWGASADGRQWKLQGDVLGTPAIYDFFYPE